MKHHSIRPSFAAVAALVIAFLPAAGRAAEAAWWNKSWTLRQPVTIDASAVTGPVGPATVLVRLHDGNFQFSSARDDGSDLRFIAADGKTELPHQIESYDGLLNEAFVWVGLPDVKPGAPETIYLYSGNQEATMAAGTKATDAFDKDTSAVFHFAERGGNPADSTANAGKSETAATTAEGAIIGNGLRLLGNMPFVIPSSPALDWKAGQNLTLSMWIKPSALQPAAVIASRAADQSGLRLLLDQGVPVVDVGGVQCKATAPLTAAAWAHLAVVADGGNIRLFVNGEQAATVAASIPALAAPLVLGGVKPEASGIVGFTGEIDEFRISNNARGTGWIQLAALNQGTTEAAQKFLSLGKLEGGGTGEQSKLMEHLSLFGDIAGNMMFDGWMAIGVCAIMILVGWTVAIRKFLYLNTVEKANSEFQKHWKNLSTDLTALDHGDQDSISSLGGSLDSDGQSLITKSPLYHIYHIGSEEIRHRIGRIDSNVEGLPGRSIQAIRASLDAGLVHENHRLTDGLVYLTISIAGGPYVGLLGTVVGVMITFAIIARSGEVNVNSIAPGIASALLATVVGLVVAIPALFIYSYLNARIKNSLSLMQVFIDEFVAKMAEFYRPKTGTETPTDGSH